MIHVSKVFFRVGFVVCDKYQIILERVKVKDKAWKWQKDSKSLPSFGPLEGEISCFTQVSNRLSFGFKKAMFSFQKICHPSNRNYRNNLQFLNNKITFLNKRCGFIFAFNFRSGPMKIWYFYIYSFAIFCFRWLHRNVQKPEYSKSRLMFPRKYVGEEQSSMDAEN